MKATTRLYDGVLAALDGPTLHALACLADDLRRPRFVDPVQAAEELAAMPFGTTPGLGWWRRHLGVTSEHRSQLAEVPRRGEEEGETMTTTTRAPTSSTYRTLVGNLTCDPKLRFSSKGTAWCSAGFAVNPRRRLDDGSYEELAAEFYELVCLGDLAEHVAECLAKGDRVVAVGRVETETWTGDDGAERTTRKLLADDVGASLRFGVAGLDRTERRSPADDSCEEPF